MPRIFQCLRAVTLAVGVLLPSFSYAQAAWPSKPVTFVVPYAAGGFGDLRARKIGEKLSRVLGVPVVVENRVGAGGVLGTQVLARATADGHTIGMGNLAPLAVNVSLMKSLPYNPATDVVPVVLLERAPLILSTSPASGISGVAELIARARAQPGRLTYGSSGIGGAHHLSGAMFASQAGIDISHVPYKGGSAAATDLLAGHISMMFEMGYAALPSIKAGKIKPLAVTSRRRLAALPDVPTLAESGLPGFESYNWQGVIVPRGTPAPIVARLSRELNAILAMPDVVDMFVSTASEIAGGSPEEFAAFIRGETVKWAAVVKAANIQPE